MKSRDLARLGVPKAGDCMQLALKSVGQAIGKGMENHQVLEVISEIVSQPESFRQDPTFGTLAMEIIRINAARATFEARQEPAPWKQWGDDLDEGSVGQMQNAVSLPVAVQGALMPDAHTGYGLPIGGVLATDGAVIPYAVGVDIACRMKMTVLDIPTGDLIENEDRFREALAAECRFGVGASFKRRRDHPVMDEDWSLNPVTESLKGKAWKQLGTSGSGNHFVEFGHLILESADLGLEAGTYLALLSHSGSRGTGNQVATHYSRLAKNQHLELPRELSNLSWLELETEAGQEYWQAMELMGRYAAANHELIHHHMAQNLGATVLLDLENHHNFAWKEIHGDREVVVHRKGATPAGS